MRKYMGYAIEEAITAYEAGEVPVGAVIVHRAGQEENIIARSHNCCSIQKNNLFHAEIQTINQACEVLGTSNLKDCTLYVTLEPCPMCAGAIIHSGISKVVFGAYDTDFGALGSYLNIANHPYAKHLEVYGGICERECSELIKKFFKEIRNVKY